MDGVVTRKFHKRSYVNGYIHISNNTISPGNIWQNISGSTDTTIGYVDRGEFVIAFDPPQKNINYCIQVSKEYDGNS